MLNLFKILLKYIHTQIYIAKDAKLVKSVQMLKISRY